ncbi:PAS domain-containing protein [Shewanella sp. D64]|uniref:helix-turn-helix transcriptional regulator n=1 Tax=unclassified Shewanella TaxID=196818 RepID=UPI0022BA6691|nr:MULTISPECIES: PAS domain-containing protein [unclassified Shewanella]MEC4727229.1 PAS domain-containing protein [Shewanella sp. D64]MEC4739154.1 PAS domain-containing protein [Shewanella sp. E94]WBJ95499.1 PAS domain-containing protein [Shewanella sp. MTB7]
MKLQELTKSDFDILKSMENVVDGIAAMYGEHTEVVLHSLDSRDPSVIKIANGHVTGRKLGAPVTNLALLKLKMGQDISNSYITRCATGKTLRSITTIIRNSQNRAIGLLCINTDMDAPLQSVLRTMMPDSIVSLDIGNTPEVFARNIDEALHGTIDSVNSDVRSNTNIAPSKKSREIVTQLYELGVFELKDSAQVAATRLDISVHSIYRYLREIKASQTSTI